MTLFANQFRKDMRQFAGMLCLFLILVVGELYFGLPSTTIIVDDMRSFQAWAGLSDSVIPALMVLLVLLIPLMLGWNDSFSDDTGFVRTRPVPGITLWGAKVVVLGVGLWLPVVLPPILICLAHGAGAGHALLAAGERLAFVVPASLSGLIWGGLGGERTRFVVASLVTAAVLLGTFWLSTGLHALIDDRRLMRIFQEPGNQSWRLLVVLWVAALVGAAVFIRHCRGPRLRRPLIPVVAGISLALFGVMMPAGFHPFPVENAIDHLREPLSRVSVRVDPYTINAWQLKQDDRVMIQAHLQTDGVPPGFALLPLIETVALQFEDGVTAHQNQDTHYQRLQAGGRLHASLLHGVADHFDEGTSLYLARNSSHKYWQDPVQVARLTVGDLAKRAQQPARLEVALGMQCQQLKRVARLPLSGSNPEATGPGQLALWDSREAHRFTLRIRRPQSWLTLDDESVLELGATSPQYYICVLKHPAHPQALVCDPGADMVRAQFSGCPEYVIQYSYDAQPMVEYLFDEAFLEGAEIHVFTRHHAGLLSVRASHEGLRLERHWKVTDRGEGLRQLDEEAMERAFARLGDVPEEPGVGDVLKVTRLVDAAESRNSRLRGKAVRRLNEIARRDLTPLVDALAGNTLVSYSRGILNEVFARHARSEDKAYLIQALPRQPALAGPLVAKGWERDARATLIEMLKRRQPLAREALRAAALLDDPEAHPYLIEQFAHHPSSSTYTLLRAVPALRPGLERVIRERWARARRVVLEERMHRWTDFELALRIGDPDALSFALRDVQSGDHQGSHFNVREFLLVPRQSRRAPERLAGRGVNDFVFSENLGLYLLRETEDRR